jgi:hypothetical protein
VESNVGEQQKVNETNKREVQAKKIPATTASKQQTVKKQGKSDKNSLRQGTNYLLSEYDYDEKEQKLNQTMEGDLFSGLKIGASRMEGIDTKLNQTAGNFRSEFGSSYIEDQEEQTPMLSGLGTSTLNQSCLNAANKINFSKIKFKGNTQKHSGANKPNTINAKKNNGPAKTTPSNTKKKGGLNK